MSTTTMNPHPGEITKLLYDWRQGDPNAMDRLMPIVIDELRRIAARGLAKRGRDLTYQATEVVSLIYLRLTGQKRAHWKSRKQFFDVCAEFVRRTLIERARQKKALCHGGGTIRVPLDEFIDESIPVGSDMRVDLIDLNNALDRLAELDERAAKIVNYRFFAGLTIKETAEVLEVSSMTVDRDWQSAKRWLFRELKASDPRRTLDPTTKRHQT